MDSVFKKYLLPKNYLEYFHDKRRRWQRRYQESYQPYLQWPAVLFHHHTDVRYFRAWQQTWKKPSDAVADGQPWFTFRCTAWLEKFLTSEMTIFEWGSGGSTLFFAPRVKKLISVEHDPAWYQLVTQALHDNGLMSAQLLLHPPQPAPNISEQPSPFNFRSWDKHFSTASFEHYVKAIDEFPDQSFDLVVADGRARLSCVMRALPKVRPDGFLLLDDSQRPYYRAADEQLARMRRIDFYGPTPYHPIFKQTTLWQMPNASHP